MIFVMLSGSSFPYRGCFINVITEDGASTKIEIAASSGTDAETQHQQTSNPARRIIDTSDRLTSAFALD
eukprot:scaffold52948_cov58-Attheya_sp.AAC.3